MQSGSVNYIGLLMFESDKSKRRTKERIALAVILVVSLGAAWLVVELRSVIRFTSPIELSRSGLSISMPQGNGWRCDGKWTYDDDGYAVSSTFAVRAGSVRSYARCRYVLASEYRTAEEWFNEDAASIGGRVVETGRNEVDKLVVDWAKIAGEGGLEMVSGVCELAGGRRLEIDVLQTGDQPGLARNIFERVVKSIRYKDNGFLPAGEQVVEEVRKAGAKEFGDVNQPVFFILSDSKGQAVGFTMDSMEIQANEEQALRAASYFYRRGLSAVEQAGYYYGGTSFEKFEWMFRQNSPRTGRVGIEMSVQSGVLTVRKSGIARKGKEYMLGEAAVPDIILEPVLKQALESGAQEIIIDVVRPEGNIVPVYIEKVIGPDSNSLKLEVLDGSGYQQQVYYNNTAEPVKKVIEQQQTTYTLNLATAEQIAKAFPERADLVFRRVLSREGI